MTGKSYELPDDITGLGGMVSWADEHGEWHTEVFEFLAKEFTGSWGHGNE